MSIILPNEREMNKVNDNVSKSRDNSLHLVFKKGD